MKIVLGTKSPRRNELLKQMGFDFIVDGVDIDEVVDSYKNPADFVRQVAIKKGKLVAMKHPDKLVISADTIVVVGEEILAKPLNKEEARKMIKMIEDSTHEVMTAIYLKYKNKEVSFVEKTKVTIDKLTEEEIENYISTKEPYDKAGGYAIQGIFGKYVKKIVGDYYNVMGLPLNKLYKQIKKFENV